jgi:hypothetical protein
MKLTYAFKFMFFLFCVITTAVMIFVSVTGLIFDKDNIAVYVDMLKIPLVAFCSVLPVMIYIGSDKAGRTGMRIRNGLHFVLTAGIVAGLLIYFGWMETSNAIFIVILFLAIYISAHTFQEIQSKKLADKLNERINEFHTTENETHPDES